MRPAEWEEYCDWFRPLEIEVIYGFEDGMRQFKSLVQKSKILTDYKESQRYEKPSEKRRRKVLEASEKNRINLLKEEQMATGEWEKKQKKIEQRRKEKQNRRNQNKYE